MVENIHWGRSPTHSQRPLRRCGSGHQCPVNEDVNFERGYHDSVNILCKFIPRSPCPSLGVKTIVAFSSALTKLKHSSSRAEALVWIPK